MSILRERKKCACSRESRKARASPVEGDMKSHARDGGTGFVKVGAYEEGRGNDSVVKYVRRSA